MRFDEGQLHAALQHEAALRRLARGLLRDPAAADDALQHTMVQAASDRGPANGGLWPFLVTTMRNHANNVRKLARRRAQHEAAAARPDAAAPVDDLLAREQLRRRVADAVLALDEPYRTTVWLRWFEELRTAAIAKRLGVPVATVRTRLQRAHAQLRQRLDADFGDRRWAALVGLPFAAVATTTLLGVSVMTKKWLGAIAVGAIAAMVFTVPRFVNSDAPPTNVANERAAIVSAPLPAADAARTERERTPTVLASDAPQQARASSVRIVHADGLPAVGFDVRWWSAADRPGWTERIDPAKVRPQWPRGMGPGAFREPWPVDAVRTGSRGEVAIPATDEAPTAISVRLANGLFFSTAWTRQDVVELPPMARLDLAVQGAPANTRWRGGCFLAWREGDDEDLNHGYARTNIDTGSGPGVVRHDRVPFAGDAAQPIGLVVLAGRPCAIEAEGLGFVIDESVAFAVAPGAVTFRAGERVPQLVVQVVAADGTDAPRSGRVWVSDETGSNSEELVAGRASLDRCADRPRRDVVCLLDDGSLLRAAAPTGDPDQDRTLRLSLANAEPPLRVVTDGGFAAIDAVWIDVDGHFVRAMEPDLLPLTKAGAAFLVGDELRLAGQQPNWRGGFVVTANGRIATFARGDARTTVRATWLADAERTIDVPALSREFGELPAFGVGLEIEARRDDGSTEWILVRHVRRLVATDHPERMEPWHVHVPTTWRARLSFTGGPTDQRQSRLEQRLLP